MKYKMQKSIKYNYVIYNKGISIMYVILLLVRNIEKYLGKVIAPLRKHLLQGCPTYETEQVNSKFTGI